MKLSFKKKKMLQKDKLGSLTVISKYLSLSLSLSLSIYIYIYKIISLNFGKKGGGRRGGGYFFKLWGHIIWPATFLQIEQRSGY